ncbi:MAG: hypothetical protein WC360_02985 [Opitutales bacterium]
MSGGIGGFFKGLFSARARLDAALEDLKKGVLGAAERVAEIAKGDAQLRDAAATALADVVEKGADGYLCKRAAWALEQIGKGNLSPNQRAAYQAYLDKLEAAKKAADKTSEASSASVKVVAARSPEPQFLRTERNSLPPPYDSVQTTKKIYSAPSKKAAIAFLKKQNVTEPFYYIEIDTPEGRFGIDNGGRVYDNKGAFIKDEPEPEKVDYDNEAVEIKAQLDAAMAKKEKSLLVPEDVLRKEAGSLRGLRVIIEDESANFHLRRMALWWGAQFKDASFNDFLKKRFVDGKDRVKLYQKAESSQSDIARAEEGLHIAAVDVLGGTFLSSLPSRNPTVVIVKIDVGFGHALFIRGEGPGMNWNRGLPMQNIASDKWKWETKAASSPFLYKVLIDDKTWADGDNCKAESGKENNVTPKFGAEEAAQRAAAEALRLKQEQEAAAKAAEIAALIVNLGDWHPVVREAAAVALEKIGLDKLTQAQRATCQAYLDKLAARKAAEEKARSKQCVAQNRGENMSGGIDYLSDYKVRNRTGWVCCFSDKGEMAMGAEQLAKAGIKSERRVSPNAFYSYWLVVGIPSSQLDDIIMPMMRDGRFTLGDESSFPTYASVVAESSSL